MNWENFERPVVVLLGVALFFFVLIQVNPPETTFSKTVLEIVLVFAFAASLILAFSFLWDFQAVRETSGELRKETHWTVWENSSQGKGPSGSAETRATEAAAPRSDPVVVVHHDLSFIKPYLPKNGGEYHHEYNN